MLTPSRRACAGCICVTAGKSVSDARVARTVRLWETSLLCEGNEGRAVVVMRLGTWWATREVGANDETAFELRSMAVDIDWSSFIVIR